MPPKRELPSKEAAVFKNILKTYEHRQYKKGLKLADSILKKFPEHGETLAMKGLFLNNLQKKEEGYEYVKKGLQYDLTSHICWHVYGLLHRADKNYAEAAKCYTHALKYNKNDIHILRDFALLQTQMRQYDALIETRTQLLQQRPTNPPFWIGLAVAHQLAGKPDKAITVLTSHEESVKDIGNKIEHSELLMYHNSLLEEMGDFKGALEHLDKIENQVMDKRAAREKRAYFQTKLDQKEEAEKGYWNLVAENPHDRAYVKALLALKGLDDESKRAEAYRFLTETYDKYPKSKAVEGLVLQYAEGDKFNLKVDAVLQNALRKGVPSVFASTKKYYGNSEKHAAIEKLVLGYRESLEKTGRFTAEGQKEPPTALLWTLYYIAQHYDYHSQHDKALETIQAAIDHSPTVVELYMTKARILKHTGQIEKAATIMNDARELDLQDRFVNSKCAKYMLRANKVEEAEKTLALFTRKEVPAIQDLADMQCQWFNIEEGYAYLRQKEYGKALKRFHTIEKIYDDIFDDQFDFHTYCARKMTLRAYVSLLRYEDHIRDHPYYLKAAKGAVEAYLAIADKPSPSNGIDESGMSEAEKKKARSKARKAELKAQKTNEKKEEAAAAATPAAKKQPDGSKQPVDQDPAGEKYLNTKTPLEDAMLFIKPLQQLAPNSIDTHNLGFEVYLRQKQWVLAIRCLLKISEINKSDPSLKLNIERFKKTVDAAAPLDPSIKKIIDLQMAKL
ncbi:NMDA receptor-regulated protein 1-domain-containing protein [Zychaea mexicana]|uniref:NMDA receptor-regulated protein 1-domain-containing protein n=1 Tax=Zychaea mexicana TaxID=64656 RepID=UPI0022FE4D78|nr:NMDA receptor-regulated protein 1-domain-containing protein [Zychaea mexicana]KAI9484379.1 NMDA receptor-regulated protein 1-domain-containing protein [Zychaea mexicana]